MFKGNIVGNRVVYWDKLEGKVKCVGLCREMYVGIEHNTPPSSTPGRAGM